MPQALQKNQPKGLHFILLIGVFILSRLIFYNIGIRFDNSALTDYWQYPDIEVLRHNLLQGIWYQSAQPPLFNLFLGGLLKLHPAYPSLIFPMTFMMISVVNTLLLYRIVGMVCGNLTLALLISMIYMLAPATILLENELFYTSFVSMLFLASACMLTRWFQTRSLMYTFLFFFGIAMICLSRSFYHLAWMALVVLLLMIKMFPAISTRKIALAAAFPLCMVAAWYGKNYLMFGTFSASSWMGMNLARLVYQDKIITDSSSIVSIPPFYPISAYENFVTPLNNEPGLPNRVEQTEEFKKGRNINMFNENYPAVSRLYLQASEKEIANHPGTYFKNVSKAWVIYFTPASSYFKVEENEKRIRYYDAFSSLNFSSFFEEKKTQKKSLVISSLVMILLYALTLLFFIKRAKHPQQISALNYFILITIFYSVLVSSFFEYGDNMRFRYEIQPLFLIAFAQYIQHLIKNRKSRQIILSYRT